MDHALENDTGKKCTVVYLDHCMCLKKNDSLVFVSKSNVVSASRYAVCVTFVFGYSIFKILVTKQKRLNYNKVGEV